MHKGHDCVAKIKPVNLKIVYNTITSMKIEPFKNCNTVYTQSMYDIVIFNAIVAETPLVCTMPCTKVNASSKLLRPRTKHTGK